jgi:hypothetical protein
VADSDNPPQTATAKLSILIGIAPLNFSTTSVPNGTVGTAYNQTLSVNGGISPYNWSVTPNNGLPAGLSITPVSGTGPNSNASIDGTPTTAGTSTFTVTVVDSETPPATASNSLSITISASHACTGTNNTLLFGNYAMMFNGWSSANAATSAIGSFVADGAGNISSGILEVSDQSSSSGPSIFTLTGTYCVGSNNLATINLTFGGAKNPNRTAEASLDDSDGNGHIIGYDSSGTLVSGLLRKQDTSAFSTSSITGNYAFGLVGVDNSGSAGRFAVAGEFNSNGSGDLSGEDDNDDAGTIQTTQTFASNFSVANTGRATATITGGSNPATNFVFYVVSASEMLMMAVDKSIPPMIMAGQVLQQSGTFTDESLNGVSVFEEESLYGTTPEAMAGLLTANGAGSLTLSGDSNKGGVVTSGTASGTYSVGSNGRATVTVSGQPVLYLVGQNEAFLVGTGGEVSFGLLVPQKGSNFNNGSLSGIYMGGSPQPFSANVNEEVDYINADGVSSLTGKSYLNSFNKGPRSSTINETYAVSSDGRVVVSQNGVQQGIIYIISTSQFIVLPGTDSDKPALIDFHQ